MASIIDVNQLANIPEFRTRVQRLLLADAMKETAKTPTTPAEQAAFESARQIVQSGGMGGGNVPLVIAVQIGGDWAATDDTIAAAIKAQRTNIYNIPAAFPVAKNSPNNPDFVQIVRRVVAKEAQKIAELTTESAQRKAFAAQTLANVHQAAQQIAQLAADNPKGDPLTDSSDVTAVNRAIKDAFDAIAPAKTI